MPEELKSYSAIHVVNGGIRRVYLEAGDEAEARQQCVSWNLGYEGEARRPDASGLEPVSVDEETARRLLGNISPSTLYREIAAENLERVPGIRKILVTVDSIKRWPERRK